MALAAPVGPDKARKIINTWLAKDSRPLGSRLGNKVDNIQTFTDDRGKPLYYVVYLKPGKNRFSCTKAATDTGGGGDPGIVTATFDFNKCSFTLTIKNTEIDDALTGDVAFGVQFAGFDESVQVTLP